MAETTPVVINSQADFTDAFTGEDLGTSQGRWRYDSGGSSATTRTGPGTNNTLSFIHTEVSNIPNTETLEDAEGRGVADFATVPNQAGRTLHMRLCLQGDFNDGVEGLEIQHRASNSDTWAQAGFVHGWTYSNNYDTGETVTDFNSVSQTFVANGGWVDFEITIPDAATQVRLQPRYFDGGGATYRHDIALRQFHWSWPDAPASVDVSITKSSGNPTAAVEASATSVTPATVQVTKSAGDPTNAVWAFVEGDGVIQSRVDSDDRVDDDFVVDTPLTPIEVGIGTKTAGDPTVAAEARPFELSDTTTISQQSDFTDAFTDENVGTTHGRWRFRSSGSPHGNTGPGTNNSLSYMHTDASGGFALSTASTNGIVTFAEVSDRGERYLHMRLCIQGRFGDGKEGLEVQHRASDDDSWEEAGFVYGWAYSDSRQEGDLITNYDGGAATCVADGGWIDASIAIPDTATQVRLHPRYISGEGSDIEHDIALRSFAWSYKPPTLASIDSSAGDPTSRASVETRTLVEGDVIIINAESDFTDAFDDETLGTNQGRWRFDSDAASSASPGTGPGTNNALTFMHTETSSLGSGLLPNAETNGIANFAEVPDEAGRILNIRLCIQGNFDDGVEGLRIEHRESDSDTWAEAALIRGWDYSDSRATGSTFSDEGGVTRTVVADGGWVDYEVGIPDSATQVRLHPRYIDDGSNRHQHDIALRQFYWSWVTAESSVTVSIASSAGNPTNSVEAAATDATGIRATIASSAGNPTNSVSASVSSATAVTATIGTKTAGDPTNSVETSVADQTSAAVQITKSAGDPTNSVEASPADSTPVTAQIAKSAGNPTNSVEAAATDPTPVTAQIASSAGDPTGSAETTVYDIDGPNNITQASDFADAFSDEQIGTSRGRWNFDSSGSSSSTQTGPGTNNTFPFMHTETSTFGAVASAEANGVATFEESTIPNWSDHTLTLRLCVQGAFSDGQEGLRVVGRANSGDAWTELGFVHGWAYSNSYSAGDTISFSSGGGSFVCVADGGWGDFTFDVPNEYTQIQLQPKYIDGDGNNYHHDIALASWTHIGLQGTPVTASVGTKTAGNPTNSVEATPASITAATVQIASSAGNPTNSIEASPANATAVTATIASSAGNPTNSVEASVDTALTLNSIPAQNGELVRALITTGTGEWWYNNRIGDSSLHGSFTGDLLIADDPTPGETTTDVELLIGTLRWFGSSGTSDQFLIRRHDPSPPPELGFNSWLTQGAVTGDDRVRRGSTTFADDDPAELYSAFFQFTPTGDHIELELRDILGSSIGTGHHFMNLRIPSEHHAAFDGVGANQPINFVIALRTSYLSPVDATIGTKTAGDPTNSVSASVADQTSATVQIASSAGNPTNAVSASVADQTAATVQITKSAGNPTNSVSASASSSTAATVQIASSAGNPTNSVSASVADQTAATVQIAKSAGNPTNSVEASASSATAATVQIAKSAGEPTNSVEASTSSATAVTATIGTKSAGNPTNSVSAIKQSQSSVAARIIKSAGDPTNSVEATVADGTPITVQIASRAGDPVNSVRTTPVVYTEAIAASIGVKSAGNPTNSVRAETDTLGAAFVDVLINKSAGDPTNSVEVEVIDPDRYSVSTIKANSGDSNILDDSSNNIVTGLVIGRVEVHQDLTQVAVYRDNNAANLSSFSDWAQADGRGLSFYFICDDGTTEYPISDATTMEDTHLEWSGATACMYLQSGEEMRIVIASSGMLGARGAHRPLMV